MQGRLAFLVDYVWGGSGFEQLDGDIGVPAQAGVSQGRVTEIVLDIWVRFVREEEGKQVGEASSGHEVDGVERCREMLGKALDRDYRGLVGGCSVLDEEFVHGFLLG